MKRYIQKINNLLLEKWLQFFLLFCSSMLFLIPQIVSEIKYIFILLFYFSFIVQALLLIRKSYFFFIFRTLLIIFLCFEISFGLLNSKGYNSNNYLIAVENYWMHDDILGYRHLPNCTKIRSVEIFGKDTAFDVCYSSDEFGRRINDEIKFNNSIRENSFKKKHAVFLGCSFTFGYGLKDSSTFPSMFENLNPDYKSYNFGVTGYGPNHICYQFDDGINIFNNFSVPEDSGFCLYTYIDDHLNRVYGGSDYLKRGENIPEVYVYNNKLVRTQRPYLQRKLTWFLNNSETMKYFNINLTYPKTDKFYKRFADIINYIAGKYWNIKPHGEFYIGLYPCNPIDTSWIKFLDKRIKVINIQSPIDFETNASYKIKYDGHPTEKLNYYYTKEFSKSIVKKN